MTPAAAPARLGSTPLGRVCLAVMAGFMLWRSFGGPAWSVAGIAASALVLIAAEYRRIPRNLATTAMLLLAASAALLPLARDPLQALARGVFVGGLLASLMAAVALLGRVALRSRQVHVIGDYLRAQPGARRYLGFTLASQLFSAMLSLAGTNILFIMAAPDESVAREKAARMVSAITRGFSAATFWSPMFGNMAILLALYPSLHWIEVFPLGFAMAQATVVVGTVMYVLRMRKAGHDDGPRPARVRIGPALAPLIAALVLFLGLVLAASATLGVTVTTAIVILAPLAAWGLSAALASERPRLGAATRDFARDVRELPSIAPEATLLMSAGCAGTIMASAFPDQWTSAISAALSGTPFLAILALIGALVAAALAGVHPVLTSVFLASTFTPPLLDLPPVTHFCTILMGWGMAAALSPFSVLSMTAARFSGLSLFRVSIGENARYTVICALVFALVLSAIVAMVR